MQSEHTHFYLLWHVPDIFTLLCLTLHPSFKQMLIFPEENAVEQSLSSRVGNADMNLGGSSPQDNSGLGTILSPPPGPHTFQPGIGGYGSPTDAVAVPGTDNADVSGKEGLCQVGGLTFWHQNLAFKF
jgi:hypothetical protein